MNIFRPVVCVAALTGITLLAACGSTKMKFSYRAPGFEAVGIHKVLVVGVFKSPDVRKAFEKDCVRQWESRGVQAIAGLDVLPRGMPLSQVGVASFAKAQGIDSVLVSRFISREKIEAPIAHPSEQSGMMIEEDANLDPYFQGIESSPEYHENYDQVTIKTTVFSVPTGQRLWSATTQTLVTSRFLKNVDSFVKVILRTLYEIHDDTGK